MKPGQFWLFDVRSTMRVQDLLNTAGDGARLKVVPYAQDKLMIHVIDADGDEHDPVNDSHVCPGSPGCP